MKIPLRTFSGYVKQIDTVGVDASQQEALASAVPQFLTNPTVKTEEELRALAVATISSLTPEMISVTTQEGLNRRFSGGKGLPRRRYYTLSRDAAGDDDLTLIAEMRAYRSCRSGRLCTILDTKYPPGHELLKRTRTSVNGPSLLIVFFKEEFGAAELQQPTRTIARVVPVPYAVRPFEIARTLDLRQVDAQEWFLHTFGVANRHVHDLPILDAHDFPALLPFLMTMELGGGGFTESIGRFLRQNSVDALIYPSARNDVWAIQKHNRLQEFGGWCLVDYRGAETSDLPLIDLCEQTPLDFVGPLAIKVWDKGMNDKSWATQGVRELYRYRFFREVEVKYGIDQSWLMRVALIFFEHGEREFDEFSEKFGAYLANNAAPKFR